MSVSGNELDVDRATRVVDDVQRELNRVADRDMRSVAALQLVFILSLLAASGIIAISVFLERFQFALLFAIFGGCLCIHLGVAIRRAIEDMMRFRLMSGKLQTALEIGTAPEQLMQPSRSPAASSTHLASFLEGMGSVLEVMPPPLAPLRRTDADALRGDWLAIGGDLRRATERSLAEGGQS
jgi:hypothetical protein